MFWFWVLGVGMAFRFFHEKLNVLNVVIFFRFSQVRMDGVEVVVVAFWFDFFDGFSSFFL